MKKIWFLVIKLFSLEEQEKIEKIENELENLKEFKKGLLQQMFI